MKKKDITADIVYPAAERWIDAALRSDGSLFIPDQPIWSLHWLEELRNRIVEQPEVPGDSFEEKLHNQLAGSPPEVYQLMGEVLFLYALAAIPASLSAGRKRELINLVLSWSPRPTDIPPDLDAVLEHGLARTGQSFGARRPQHLATIVRFVEMWKRLDAGEQSAALHDPWKLKALVDQIQEQGAFGQRAAILHFVHPDTFDAVLSATHRDQILGAFPDSVDPALNDPDRRLVALREALTETYGNEFSWYQDDVREVWVPASSAWDQFIAWARLFFNDPEYDDRERIYKLHTAEMVQQVEQELDGDPARALELLKIALTSYNLIHWRTSGPYLTWAAENWEEAREGLHSIWDPETETVDRLRGFFDVLPKEVISGLGGRLNIASVLLMAHDPHRFPPLRSEPFVQGRRLTNSPRSQSSSDEVERYLEDIAFLGEIIDEAHQRDLPLRDLLDAQSVVWSVTSGTLTDPAQQVDLERWRSTKAGEQRDLGEVAEPPTAQRVWWVNQGSTYQLERAGGYIWAPQTTKAGHPVQHHTNVSETKLGDVVIHYVNGAIRAIGLVASDGAEAGRPAEITGDHWGDAGYLAEVEYFELGLPIALTEIPVDLRSQEQTAFTKVGNVNQGYLYRLSETLAERLRNHFHDRWPVGSPWHRLAGRRAVVVYVGKDARENFEYGRQHGVWGWKERHVKYDQVRPGDLLIYGGAYTGGSPRTQPEDFAKNGIGFVWEADVESAVLAEQQPLWPDEVREGELKYPYRVRTSAPQGLGSMSVAELNERYGADIGEALRISAATGGRGVIVMVDVAQPATANISGVSLAEVCAELSDHIVASGLNYGIRHEELIRSFVVSLATKRFALLTGLSGSGKTRLGLAFGQWLGEAHYKVVAVRPDWTGPDALLGYENLLSAPRRSDGARAWVVPETLEVMLRAAIDETHPYLLILDEMNLAHVERYFADVLSGIESGKEILPNLKHDGRDWYQVQGGAEKLTFPSNLFVVGTVNIDETTYMFSPKVLDRANTLEFRVLTADLNDQAGALDDVKPGDARLLTRFLADACDQTLGGDWAGRSAMADALINLHGLLGDMDREFGHRVFHEALRFGALQARAGVDDWRTALDLQVMQKVLPRFHGSLKQIAEPLRMIGSWCFNGPGVALVERFDPLEPPEGDPALPVSFSKTARMYRRVLANHFVSFAE